MALYMYAGDVVEFTFTVNDPATNTPVNLSVYTTVKIAFSQPGGGSFLVVATLPEGGTDGITTYQTSAGQIATPGTWQAQVVCFTGAVEVAHSTSIAFQVFPTVG